MARKQVNPPAGRRLALAGLIFLLAGLTACRFSLVEDLYVLKGMEKCPDQSLEAMSKDAIAFDHGTKDFPLYCALDLLRRSVRHPIHRSQLPARICYLLADRGETSASRERLAAEGVRWAEIALEQPAMGQEGAIHYYLAANLGLAVYESTALAVKNLKRLHRELESAMELAPEVDEGGPMRVMGMLLLMAPPWPRGIGDGEEAVELLEKAVTEYPKHPLNHIFYAQCLWEVEEEEAEDKVREHLKLGMELLKNPRWGDAEKRWSKLLQDLAKEAGASFLPPAR